jgi:LacI family repressor for deo operon, udp, cdd, tsx, nupC, and nupG
MPIYRLINYMENIPAASVEQFPYLQGQKATDILMDLLHHQDRAATSQSAFYKVIIESQLVENKK